MMAGKLRHRVTIMADSGETRDQHGHRVPRMESIGQAWASVQPLRGTELWRAQQVQPEVTHRVRIRHRNGLTRAQQVVHANRTFDVLTVLNRDERNIELELLCRESI